MNFLIGLFLILSFNCAHASIKWGGSATLRYMILNQDDGLGASDSLLRSRKFQFRASVQGTHFGEWLDEGIGFRTLNGPAAEFVYFQNDLDRSISLELAFARMHSKFGANEMSFTFGRQNTVMLYDKVAQSAIDRDVRWDGFGETWRNGIFGFSAGQYLLGSFSAGAYGPSAYTSTNGDARMGWLWSFQPNLRFHVANETDATFAVGYHIWNHVEAPNGTGFYPNRIHGTYGPHDVAPLNLYLSNPRIWQFYTEWKLPMLLTFTGEYVRNKKTYYGTGLGSFSGVEADRDSYGLSLGYGRNKRKNDLGFTYTYASRGLGSGFATYTWSEFPIDNKGHVIDERFVLMDGVNLVAREYFLEERSGRDGSGALPANSNRHTSTRRYEITATAEF